MLNGAVHVVMAPLSHHCLVSAFCLWGRGGQNAPREHSGWGWVRLLGVGEQMFLGCDLENSEVTASSPTIEGFYWSSTPANWFLEDPGLWSLKGPHVPVRPSATSSASSGVRKWNERERQRLRLTPAPTVWFRKCGSQYLVDTFLCVLSASKTKQNRKK